jgi:hypothetical protein
MNTNLLQAVVSSKIGRGFDGKGGNNNSNYRLAKVFRAKC